MVKKLKLSVPKRKLETYNLDCGWRVESYILDGNVEIELDFELPDDHPSLKNKDFVNKEILTKEDIPADIGVPEFNDKKEIYFGIGAVMTRIGARNIKFEINENTLDEAFKKWNFYASPAAEEEIGQVNEYLEQKGRKIQEASPDVLKKLDEQLKRGDGTGIIIP
jgi:hypothetical protein